MPSVWPWNFFTSTGRWIDLSSGRRPGGSKNGQHTEARRLGCNGVSPETPMAREVLPGQTVSSYGEKTRRSHSIQRVSQALTATLFRSEPTWVKQGIRVCGDRAILDAVSRRGRPARKHGREPEEGKQGPAAAMARGASWSRDWRKERASTKSTRSKAGGRRGGGKERVEVIERVESRESGRK